MNQRFKVLGLVLLGAVFYRPSVADSLDDVSRALEAGRFGAAIQALDRMGPNAPDDARRRFLRGAALAGKGEKAEAIKVFKALIADFPGQPEPYNNLAALYVAEGRLKDAKEVLDRAIRTNKSYATVYDNLTTVYSELGRESYLKALRVKQSSPLPRLRMLYAFNQNPSAAIAKGGSQEPQIVAAVRPTDVDKAAGGGATKGPRRLPEVSPIVAKVSPEPGEKAPAATQALAVPAKTARPTQTLAVAAVSAQPDKKADTAAVAEVPSSATAGDSEKSPSTGTVSKAGPDETRTAVLATLEGWARAWSVKDADAYLAYYGQDFVPPAGQTRDAWEAQRRQRLAAPEWIRVDLKDVKVTPRSPDRVAVRLVQHYASPGYEDKTVKRFTLISRDGHWTIQSEKSLKIIR